MSPPERPQMQRRLRHLLDEAAEIIRHNDAALAPWLRARRRPGARVGQTTLDELLAEAQWLRARAAALRAELLAARSDAMEVRAKAQAARNSR